MYRVLSYLFNRPTVEMTAVSLGFVAHGLMYLENPVGFAFNATCVAIGCAGLAWQGLLKLEGY